MILCGMKLIFVGIEPCIYAEEKHTLYRQMAVIYDEAHPGTYVPPRRRGKI